MGICDEGQRRFQLTLTILQKQAPIRKSYSSLIDLNNKERKTPLSEYFDSNNKKQW